MADPVIVSCTADTWVKVATNVKSGWVHRLTEKTAVYMQNYRMTGGVAPTDLTEGVQIFEKDESEEIGANVGIDVYIYCVGETGSVRVDV